MDSSSDSFKSATFDGLDQNQKIDKTFESVQVFESIKNEEEEEYHRKTRKRLIIIIISSIILVLLVIGAIIGVLVPMNKKNNSSPFSNNAGKDSIKKICNSTLYQDSCYSSIYSLKISSSGGNSNSNPDSPKEIFMLSLQVTFNELVKVKSSMSKRGISFIKNDNSIITRNALDTCVYLTQDAIDHVNMSILHLNNNIIDNFSANVVSDFRTWISTAITDQQTCLDGLMEFEDNISPSLQEEIQQSMKTATIFTSNSLAIISNMCTIIKGFQIPVDRKLLQEQEGNLKLRPNLTIAKDGSGDYQSINEALNVVPKRSHDRFFIYVKEGEYEENVLVASEYWNIMIYGDGMNKSIVSAQLNYADGVTTFNTGTFIVEGRGFIAQDIGFKNTAGPEKLQAVALRSSSDHSIFHRCLFDGFQDTLYAHTNRQFYKNCLIIGTIDFIFGNAAVVFQNCSIQPRQPGPYQYNTITAQSKSDPNENTGFAMQRCRISPFGNLTARTFLGRPWNNYSTIMIMDTDINGIIDPEGWIAWEPDVEAPDTIFYAEYNNSGPGSSLDRRVMWSGYRRNVTEEEARSFSVEKFIQGDQWITRGNLEYDSHI